MRSIAELPIETNPLALQIEYDLIRSAKLTSDSEEDKRSAIDYGVKSLSANADVILHDLSRTSRILWPY